MEIIDDFKENEKTRNITVEISENVNGKIKNPVEQFGQTVLQ